MPNKIASEYMYISLGKKVRMFGINAVRFFGFNVILWLQLSGQ